MMHKPKESVNDRLMLLGAFTPRKRPETNSGKYPWGQFDLNEFNRAPGFPSAHKGDMELDGTVMFTATAVNFNKIIFPLEGQVVPKSTKYQDEVVTFTPPYGVPMEDKTNHAVEQTPFIGELDDFVEGETVNMNVNALSILTVGNYDVGTGSTYVRVLPFDDSSVVNKAPWGAGSDEPTAIVVYDSLGEVVQRVGYGSLFVPATFVPPLQIFVQHGATATISGKFQVASIAYSIELNDAAGRKAIRQFTMRGIAGVVKALFKGGAYAPAGTSAEGMKAYGNKYPGFGFPGGIFTLTGDILNGGPYVSPSIDPLIPDAVEQRGSVSGGAVTWELTGDVVFPFTAEYVKSLEFFAGVGKGGAIGQFHTQNAAIISDSRVKLAPWTPLQVRASGGTGIGQLQPVNQIDIWEAEVMELRKIEAPDDPVASAAYYEAEGMQFEGTWTVSDSGAIYHGDQKGGGFFVGHGSANTWPVYATVMRKVSYYDEARAGLLPTPPETKGGPAVWVFDMDAEIDVDRDIWDGMLARATPQADGSWKLSANDALDYINSSQTILDQLVGMQAVMQQEIDVNALQFDQVDLDNRIAFDILGITNPEPIGSFFLQQRQNYFKDAVDVGKIGFAAYSGLQGFMQILRAGAGLAAKANPLAMLFMGILGAVKLRNSWTRAETSIGNIQRRREVVEVEVMHPDTLNYLRQHYPDLGDFKPNDPSSVNRIPN